MKIRKIIAKKIDKLMFYSNSLSDIKTITSDYDYNNKNIRQNTATSFLGLVAYRDALKYICKNNISGAIVECGVWKGGDVYLALQTLLELNQIRDVYLLDTYEGMTKPSSVDVSNDGTYIALKKWEIDKFESWGVSSVEEIKELLYSTGYPQEKLHFIKGDVLKTIPEIVDKINNIAFLKLDTDWYASTKIELEYLYPKVSEKGIVIVDDYGYWAGSKKATDDYFNGSMFLNRIDSTGRLIIKN